MAKISMPKSWWRQRTVGRGAPKRFTAEVAYDNGDEQTWRLVFYLQLDTELGAA